MLLPVIIFVASIFAVFPAMGELEEHQSDVVLLKSVEIGVVDMSPLGTEGGYAVPASACANPIATCTLYMGGGCEQWVYTCPPSPTASLSRSVNGAAFVASDATVNVGNTLRLQWSSTNATACSATAGPGFAASGTSGTDSAVTIPAAGASATYTVTCTGAGGTASASRIIATAVPSTPLPTVTLYRSINGVVPWLASNVTVNVGDTARLHWTSANATACSATAGSGFVASGTTGVDAVNIPAAGTSGTYTVSCSGPGGVTAASRIITTNTAPPLLPTVVLQRSVNSGVFVASDVSVNVGDSLALRWGSTNATACSATAGPGFAATGVSGTDTVVTIPAAGTSGTYTVSCSGPGGVRTASRIITTDAPPTVTLYRSINGVVPWLASNVTVNVGDTARLHWTSTNATACSATAGSGFVASGTTGVDAVNIPAAGTSGTYTVSCSGPGGTATASRIITTNVQPTVILYRSINGGAFVASNATVDMGDTLSLRWTSTDSSTCTATAGPGFTASGASGTDPATIPAAGTSETYTVSCTGFGGTVSDSRIITTNAMGGIPDLTADPLYVRIGEDVTLEWNLNSNPPITCTLVGPDVNLASLVGQGSSRSVPIYAESTFTLTCPGGTDTAVVKVLPKVQET